MAAKSLKCCMRGPPRVTATPAAAADPQAFCEQLGAIDQAGPPEAGGNNADEFTALLAVSEARIADDVETLRDYHRAVYVEATRTPTPTTAFRTTSARRCTVSTRTRQSSARTT